MNLTINNMEAVSFYKNGEDGVKFTIEKVKKINACNFCYHVRGRMCLTVY